MESELLNLNFGTEVGPYSMTHQRRENSRFLGFPGPVMRLHYWKHDLNDVGSASPLEWYTINHQP